VKHTLTLGTLSLVTAVILVGCGSDDTSSEITPSAELNTETLTGYFIDSAVANVDYKTTSGLSGTTDKFGRFQYKDADKVSLYIGSLLLGEVVPTEEGLITPKILADGDLEKEELLLRTLQTLDADGNPSNGIVIPETVKNDLSKIEETSVDDLNETSIITLIDRGDKHNLDKNYDGEIDVSTEDAHAHFDDSEKNWNEGKRPEQEHEENHDELQMQEGEKENQNGHSEENNATVMTEEHGYGTENNATDESHGDGFDISKYPTSILSPELKNSLSYMGNEERLAYDVYQNLYKYHLTESATEIKQLKNISEKSEIKHIGIVQDIVKKYNLSEEDFTNVTDGLNLRDSTVEAMPSGQYDIEKIQILYNALYAKGIVSTNEALMVGCMVEVTDIEDLDKYIVLAENSNATDIVEAFNVLRDGSYNHYWAFDNGLKKAGITNGCFVEGDSLLTNKEGVYPTNDKHQSEREGSEEDSKGKGKGKGKGKNAR